MEQRLDVSLPDPKLHPRSRGHWTTRKELIRLAYLFVLIGRWELQVDKGCGIAIGVDERPLGESSSYQLRPRSWMGRH